MATTTAQSDADAGAGRDDRGEQGTPGEKKGNALRRANQEAARRRVEIVEREENDEIAAAYAAKSGLGKVFDHVHAEEECPPFYGLFLLELTALRSKGGASAATPDRSRSSTRQSRSQETSSPARQPAGGTPTRFFKYEPKRKGSIENARRLGGRSHTPSAQRKDLAPLTAVNEARRPYHHYEHLDLLIEAAAEERLMPAPVLPFSPCPSPFGRETLMAKKRRQQSQMEHAARADSAMAVSRQRVPCAAHLRLIAARIEARYASDGAVVSVGETARTMAVLRRHAGTERMEQRLEANPYRKPKLPPIAPGRPQRRLEAVNTFLSTRANSPGPAAA